MVVGVAVLSEPDHNQLVRLIVECGQPTESWHGVQNSTLRSAQDSRRWLIEQVSGDFLKYIRETLAKMSNLQALQRCRIKVDPNYKPHADDSGGIEVVREDDMCAYLAGACFSMSWRRLARCLWMVRGWLVRFAGLLGSPAVRRRTLDDFEQDLNAYSWLKGQPNLSCQAQKVLERSCMAHATNFQYIEVLLGCAMTL